MLTIPTPLPDCQDYFQILLDRQIGSGAPVHLSFVANKMAKNSPTQLGPTWLTGGGGHYQDFKRPQMHVVDDASGAKGGPAFDATYDILLDDLPVHAESKLHVLKIPFSDQAQDSLSLAGSGRLYITIGAPAVMQINCSNGDFAIAQPSPDRNGAGYENLWDFVELNFATPDVNGKQVCFCDTTNVDFFALGVAIKGRRSDGNTATFGPALKSKTPVADIRAALQALTGDYKHGLVESAPGEFLRFLAPDLAFSCAATALDKAIEDGYSRYAKKGKGTAHKLTFSIGSATYDATATGNALHFTVPKHSSGAVAFTIEKPSTLNAIAATGPLCVAGQSDYVAGAQKFIAAAINRGVFEDAASWGDSNKWYPANVESNKYAQILHAHFVHKACYAFSFDDVPGPPVVSAPAIADCTSMGLLVTDC